MELINNNLILLIALTSPLDQFGADSFGHDIINLFKCGILDTLDIFNLDELLDISFLQNLLSTFVSTYFYDDDDCADSEWEDNDMNISGIQSSILIANVLGMIPGLETLTSDASLTFFFSVATMITLILIGFSLHNIRYFAILFPAGTPLIMTPFIILIEFVSYMARAISLGMRLFANMFAGHSLVKILMSFAWLFLTSAIPLLSVPVFILLLIIFLMELGIAYLQSYVFGALAAMYFEDIITLGH
jgi:ATP synthase subunit 6